MTNKPTVVVLDYGSGNVHSACKALEEVGAKVLLSADPTTALAGDGLVVPGVGAFAACMDQLTAIGGDQIIRERVEAARPLLGICVGHQVLFSLGVEHGVHAAGVGIYPGAVQLLPTARLPHMGWNLVTAGVGSRFFNASPQRYYFVHSYAALEGDDLPDDAISMITTHDDAEFVSAVEWRSVLSTQFHPEKSGPVGLHLLSTWVGTL